MSSSYIVFQAVLSTQNSSDPLADQVYAMSSLDLVDVMDEFSQLSILRVVVGCLIIVSCSVPCYR